MVGLAWRPITAIREAAADGNARTAPDPDWTPLSTTANHPEYVSGHACLTGAITRDHFRKGGTDGTTLGNNLAKWALARFFGET